MASRAETLARRRAERTAEAEDAIDADGTLDVGTSDKRRHVRDKLMGEILLEDALRRAGKATGVQVQGSAVDTRRLIAGVQASVRPSARQRFVDATFVDAAGDLLPAAKKRLERDLAADTRAEERAQIAERRRLFKQQRALLSRGSSALATRQKSRAMNTRAPKMPVRRSTRKPASKMWVPTGRVTTMAAHRKRSAAARSGGLIGRPRANMPRRGGAFLGSPTSMIREAAASAVASALKHYVKPVARKAVKAGSRWAKGAGHRAVNSLSKTGEAALLNMIGSGLNLPGVPRRRVGGAMPRRISRVPGSFCPSASRARVGSGIRLATGRRRPAGRR
jgi:hypothetical protein